MTKSRKQSRLLLFAKTFFIASFVLSVLVVGGAWVAVNYMGPPQPPSLTETVPQEPQGGQAEPQGGLRAPEGFTAEDRRELFYTFLIVGLDSQRITDTIIVAAFDGVTNTASAMSIPRDTRVNVRRNYRKINVAHSAGTRFGNEPDSGIRQLKREVRSLIGFEPDFFVEIDMEAFTRIVDAIGGVSIDVPFHMRYDDPFQNLSIDIPAGVQRLDGEQAMHFARFRNANRGFRAITDYQRMENQQVLIAAMLRSLITPASILRIPEFISIFEENVSTNIRPQDVLWFASRLHEVRGADAFSAYTLPISRNSGPPNWYEFVNAPAALELINRTINPFTIPITTGDVDIVQ